jgi:hypothetical protein
VADVVYGTQDRDLIDKAVRLVIFVIIVVFDPLAVLLLIAANQTYRRLKDKPEIEIKKVVRKKKIDKNDSPSLESFLVDDNHQVIAKDKIVNMNGDMNERS